MKQLFFGVLLMSLSLLTSAQSSPEWTDQILMEKPARLEGFEIVTAEYTGANVEFVGTTETGTPNTFLTTKNHYADFILEYEMKMERGLNSGVQIQSNSLEGVQ